MQSPKPPLRLQDVTGAEGYAARALEIIQRVSTAEDNAAVIDLLHAAKHVLGAEQAAFVSFIRDDESQESFRFLVACEAAWCLEYQQQGWFSKDAWLLYAMSNSEPICASKIPLRTRGQREAFALAVRHGVASAYIVPAPASSGLSRLGVLMLGSSIEGYFESPAAAALKVVARSFAMELHEWWVRQVRKEIIALKRLTAEDLQLFQLERRGLTTKEIARELGMSASSVDCRFQRLNAKLNAPSRHVAGRIAAEYGLI